MKTYLCACFDILHEDVFENLPQSQRPCIQQLELQSTRRHQSSIARPPPLPPPPPPPPPPLPRPRPPPPLRRLLRRPLRPRPRARSSWQQPRAPAPSQPL